MYRRYLLLKGEGGKAPGGLAPVADQQRLEPPLAHTRKSHAYRLLVLAAPGLPSLLKGEGGALTLTALFDQLDQLAETADERGEAILGALYDYAEMIAPQAD